MKQLQCDVLVIGGGSTGTGTARDLAMRGFKTILVERRDLTYGTTGRYHGLLHSGGRYVVKDPQSAQECYEENLILRRIMPQCIEDTSGFFVLTPWDDARYLPLFMEGCHKAGIPVEDVSIAEMLKLEPALNPDITHCYRVPDGAADSFLAADLNAESARQHGAMILTYHEVEHLLCEDNRVNGAVCHDLVKDEQVQISSSMVVNAAGAWAGKISASAGIAIQMIPGKGTMIAINHRIVNTVINRCKPPADGDILVPAHTVAVIGTTDVKVNDPDIFGIEPWELRLLMDEGEKLIPGFRSYRVLRAWAGVRPLFQETNIGGNDRDVTRAFVLLDHSVRDGVDGLLTITSGKWTTYRKMAEVTTDKVCEKLGIQQACRTHLEMLPTSAEKQGLRAHFHTLGARLAQVEKQQAYGNLVCECELVTSHELEHSIIDDNIHTLDDLRRDLRLGMGPCQGAYCTLRAAGILHAIRQLPVTEINSSIHDFLEERWKGQRSILWGQQLRQIRLNELIYKQVLNIQGLPGIAASHLAAENYAPASSDSETPPEHHTTLPVLHQRVVNSSKPTDVLVIGGGLAGMVTAWRALQGGKSVRLITKGLGALNWSSGCIDILNHGKLDEILLGNSSHPYILAGLPGLEEALESFKQLCASAGYPLHGTLMQTWSLPTAVGSLRRTCLAPETMIAGDASSRSPMLIVGFAQFNDFYPALIARNLNAQSYLASEVMLDLPSLRYRKSVTSMDLARMFDTPTFRAEVITSLNNRKGSVARIGFPSVLGLNESQAVKRDLEEHLGVQIFEIPGLPPSIPGMRLQNLLINEIIRLGGQIFNGMQVIGGEVDGQLLKSVTSEAAARYQSHSAGAFVLATGGLLGGGITIADHGYAHDSALRYPIYAPKNRNRWHQREFLSAEGHPLHSIGLCINTSYQPLDPSGKPYHENLYAVGGALGGFDPVQEGSLEGIALVSGYMVGEKLA